jgi:hypothetical protein
MLRLARGLGESQLVTSYLSYAVTVVKYSRDIVPAIRALLLAKQYVASEDVELMVSKAISRLWYVDALENNIDLDPC